MKDSVRISPENFRRIIQGKDVSLSGLADKLEISKQTVNSWLSSASLPAKHFIRIQNLFSLNSRELDAICEQQLGAVLFRTRRNYSVMKKNQEIAANLAQDYFDFFWTLQDTKPVQSFGEKKSIESFSKKMREELSLNHTISLTALIKKLEFRGIHVLFADFEFLFDFTEISKKNVPCAFCYKHEDQHSIVINIKEKMDDIPWIIFHELAHIFRGDLTNGSPLVEDDEIEKFCNKAATEALMPEKWFHEREDEIRSKFSHARPSVVYMAEEICRELNASLKGLALRLNDLDLISGQVRNYLMGACNRKEKTSLRITDYISDPYDQDRVEFWTNAFRGFETQK